MREQEDDDSQHKWMYELKKSASLQEYWKKERKSLLFSNQFLTNPTVAIIVSVLPRCDTAETLQFTGLLQLVTFTDENQSNPTFDIVAIETLVKEMFLFVLFYSYNFS